MDENKKIIFGVTGNISTGKTFGCQQFQNIAITNKVPFHLIEVDIIRRDILYSSKEEDYLKVRKQLVNKLKLKTDNFFSIHGKELGEKIFSNVKSMEFYNKVVNPIILDSLKKRLKQLSGVIMIEWAMLIEDGFLPLIKDDVILFTCDNQAKQNRLIDSDLPKIQVMQRIAFQGAEIEKKKFVKLKVKLLNKKLTIINTSKNPSIEVYKNIFSKLLNVNS